MNNVIWYKVWADLWHNKVRTLLAVLSIAVGVFAIGAMFGMADQLISGMDKAHQAVTPAHLDLFLRDPIDRDTAIRLKSIPEVEDVEVLNSVSIRYKLKPEDEWQPGLLVMRDDYLKQKYDVWQLKAGDWPEKDNIGIERLSSQVFGIDIGDKVIFELDRTDRALPITAKIRHPFVEPPQFGGKAVFFTDAQGLERFNIPAGTFNNLKVRVKPPYSMDKVQQVASEIKIRLGKERIGVAAAFYPDPQEHWGRFIVEGIMLVLQILAVMSLLMSVVLVTNTMTALITQQTHQIGIIKSIGGKTVTIITIYLSGVLVYGLLALIIAVPPGALLAFGMSKNFLNFFNIDYNTFQVSPRALVFQTIASLLVPLLAALRPVLTGATITVRQAIASYGLGGDFGFSRLDRFVERLGQRFLASPYAIALGNMFRRKARLALTQLVLVAAGTMFLVVMSLSASITYSLDNDLNRRAYDVRIDFEDPQRTDRTEKMATTAPGVEQAELWYTHPATLLKPGQRLKEAGISAEIVGVPANSDMFRPLILAGRWLEPGDGRVLVIGKTMADDHHLKVGDMLTLDLAELGHAQWQVIGIFQVIFSGDFDAAPIYAPQETLFTTTKQYNRGQLLFARASAHDPATVMAVNARLKDVYAARQMDINTYDSATSVEDREDAEGGYSISISMLVALAIIVAVVGGIGLMGSLSISVVERTREIGVMRAVGGRTWTIMSMFILEGVLQGVMSWFVAAPLSFILGQPLSGTLGQVMFEANLDYQYNYAAVFIWLVVVVIISILASILPARNATRISVRESLAYA